MKGFSMGIAVLAVLGVSRAAGAAAPVDAGALKAVCTAASPTPLEKGTALFVQEAIKRFYGVSLEVVESASPVDGGRGMILLGRAAAAAGAFRDRDVRGFAFDEYAVECGDGRIAVAGRDAWATYYGAVALFRRLGARFYRGFPGRTMPWWEKCLVPKPETRLIGPFSFREKPVFTYRCGGVPALGATALADPRRGADPELFDAKKTGSNLWLDHTAGYLVPRLLYLESHPEYYAMGKDGTRMGKQFSDASASLCFSNPDVTRISIDRMLKWIDMSPDERFFMVTNGDTVMWCQCPECLKMDPAPGQYATRELTWANAVAKAAAAKYPGRMFVTFAYAGSDVAPAALGPEKNLLVCGSTGLGNLPFWDHSAKVKQPWRETGIAKMDGWLKVAPRQYTVCEYLSNVYEPAPLDNMTARLRYYMDRGLAGVYATYGAPANFRGLWQYVWAEMMWDPRRDARECAREYAEFSFGPAAPAVMEVLDIYHRRYVETLASCTEMAGVYPKGYYEGAFVRAALGAFARAADAAGKNAALRKEIQGEEIQFLQDVVAHPPSAESSAENTRDLKVCLDRLRELAKESGAVDAFLERMRGTLLKLESANPAYRAMVADWLGAIPEARPVKTDGGLLFAPQTFLFGDLGPTLSQETVHKDYTFPPKVYVGILGKAKDSRGNWTSGRMAAAFTIDAVPGDGAAVLEIEGQDATTMWANAKALAVLADIRVVVNGTELFAGPSGFVRGNWSRRSFPVKPGILKQGENLIEIYNRTGGYQFATAHFLLSEAKLTFLAPR